jgi:hypothetical protein
VVTVALVPADPQARETWRSALDLMAQLEGEWTLIGGLMVQLHVERYGARGVRPTDDLDILANSRRRPSVTELISQRLAQLGFELAAPTGLTHDTAYRFTRGDLIVDVLGPDGVGRRPPRTIGNLETIQIEGGTQALARTEVVRVRLEGTEAEVRCPSLLGALLLKARSATKKDREQDREDLLRLLICVQDPQTMRDDLRETERRWLLRADRTLAFDDPDLTTLFAEEEIRLARAAWQLLTARS